MNDLKIIKKIEKQTRKTFQQIDILELNKGNFNSNFFYSINKSGRVIGLSFYDERAIDFSFVEQLHELETLFVINLQKEDCNFLASLPKLNKLCLFLGNLTDISVLSHLKGLTELNLSTNFIRDISILNELKKLTKLQLSGNNITDISVLNRLKELTVLSISNNIITDISVLSKLKKLTCLDLSNNKFTDISILCELKGLTELNLLNNDLTDISVLGKLKELSELSLSNNKISDISILSKLKELTFLHLNGNKFIDISVLSELKNLNELYLSNNNLTDISILSELKNLIALYLENNNLTDVSILSELNELSLLSLTNNKITDISFIKDLPKLKNIFLDGNPDIKEPDKKIIRQGAAAIRSYFLQKEKAGTDYLYEAKVLFVGEPEAGKTSVMKKLIDPSYKVNPAKKEKSTLGIDIRKWPFELPNNPDIKFKAHFWDFGGQNIQYYIHQFFLTERSVYVLLIDDRKDNSNVDYWFNIIKLLGKGSPVLLVRNEKNINSSTNFDNIKYEKRYSEFFKIIYCKVDLKKDDGRFEVIRNQLKELLCNLEHVGTPMLTGWIKVREDLEKLRDRNYIPFSELIKICENYNIIEEVNQLVLCNYLHDLGILLHYRNESGLADTVFLNPHWITKAVYTILDEKHLEKTKGSFSKEWLFEKWGSSYTFDEKNKILLLMQKEDFDICYQLKNTTKKSYLFPQLLNDVTPEQANNWQRKGSLSFRYRYPFMPKGIITRITVRLSDWIQSENLVWKSGVILIKDDCRALIKEDISREGLKVIDISVTGDVRSRKELLSHIRYSMDALHNIEDNKIELEKLIPCCCENCIASEDPGYFELSRLQNFVKADQHKINCEKVIPFSEVKIEELLEGVVKKTVQSERYFENRKEEFRKDKPTDELLQLLMKMGSGTTNINNYGDVFTVTKSPKYKIITKKSKNKNSKKGVFGWISVIIFLIAALLGINKEARDLFFKSEDKKTKEKSEELTNESETNFQSIVETNKLNSINSTNQLSSSKLK